MLSWRVPILAHSILAHAILTNDKTGEVAVMSTMVAEKIKTLDACFGNYPQTKALKDGSITSDRVALHQIEVNPIFKAFEMMVRQQKFDVSEMALVTYLQGKAFGKPLTLIPAT